MNVLTAQLPSGGIGYGFPSVSVSPMNFMEICKYLENVPPESAPMEKYMYNIEMLLREDPKIMDCYMMDVDFLIFFKKLITVSGDLKYDLTITCPVCGEKITKTINFDSDIHFKGADEKVMKGARVELGGHIYEIGVPTLKDFMKVFEVYLRYKKITDLKMIKTISLINDFNLQANQIEEDILGATHNDITLLLALRDLYFDRVEPIEIECPKCRRDKNEKGGVVAVSIESLITDFFRDLIINSPIDGSKVLFK